MRYTTFIMAAFLFAGCTAPTQPIAKEALKRGMTNDDAHILDLARIAKQNIAERYAAQLATKPAPEVVFEAINEAEKVSFIQIEHAKNTGHFLLTLEYVGSQEGVLDLWYNDFKASQDAVKPTEKVVPTP